MAAHDAAEALWRNTSLTPSDVDIAQLYDPTSGVRRRISGSRGANALVGALEGRLNGYFRRHTSLGVSLDFTSGYVIAV
jgi:hypothetical protein